VELTIEKMSSDGNGIARTGEGVIFVSGALPGEVVEAEISQRKRDFALARVTRVIQPNPKRITPACPSFGTCGGCQLQHASYGLQLEIKADIVRDALTRIGGFTSTAVLGAANVQRVKCEPSPSQWGYRNKAAFPVRKIKGKPTAGYYEAGSHRLALLRSCPVNAAPLNSLFTAIQGELPSLYLGVYDEREHKGALRHIVLRAGIYTGQTLASLVVNGRLSAKNMNSIAGLCRALKNVTTFTLNHNSRPGNTILGDRTEAIKGDGCISEKLDEWTLRYDTSSFFQVNTDQAIAIYRHVRDLASAGKAKDVLELYSGVGSLTCYLARAEQLTAVEEWRSATGLMSKNLESNGLTNVMVINGKAEDVMTRLSGPHDLLVMDPPRSGCERPVLDRIIKMKINRVIYVSCNPATLARDAKVLKEAGYTLKSVRAFDMFPQTVHVETVVLMER